VARAGKLPVTLFTAGGIAPRPTRDDDAARRRGRVRRLRIFKSGNPAERAAAIVKATTFYDDPDVLAKVSRGLGEAMVGINVETSRSRTGSPSGLVMRDEPLARRISVIAWRSKRSSTSSSSSQHLSRWSLQPESGFLQRTFGGHVAGQSLVSAVRTVEPKFQVHSCTGTSCAPATPPSHRLPRRAAA